ncbi:MAG: tetratricopeptide repeat protein, partial [Bacteroidetes bacterium]|nr:tetratricopeptide repeat protein [Bacteroidota bacterium]
MYENLTVLKKRYSLFFVLLLLLPVISTGQNNKEIDSLRSLLPTLPADTSKVEVLNLLASYIVDIDPDKSIEYSKDAFAIAKKKDLRLYQAISLNNIGNGYYNLADYKICLDYYIQALKIQESIGNKKGILSSTGAIGNVYIGLSQNDEALKYFERALKIANELESKIGIASCLIAIGTVQSNKGDFESSLDYFFKSLKLFQEVNNEDAIATNYNNIADSYQNLKDYPKALFYITKAAELYEKTGNVYGQSLALNNIGDFYHSIGNEQKALEYFERGLKVGKQIDANDHVIQSYKGMSRAYKGMGNYKQALEVHELFQQMNDSIYNVESSNQIAEMQARFDSEKKEQEIALLTKDKRIQEDELDRQSLII